MFAAAIVATLALALRASAFGVSTPDHINACDTISFDITSGSSTDKYTAFIVHGDDPCGPEIDEVHDISGTSFTWKAKVAPGTSIMVALSNGSDEQWNGAVTVGGSDTSCITGASPAVTPSASHSSGHASVANTAPVNAASSAPSASAAASASGASRAVFGISSALAVLGAAAVGLSL